MIPAIEKITSYTAGNFFLIAGPCVVENEEITNNIAQHLKKICHALEIIDAALVHPLQHLRGAERFLADAGKEIPQTLVVHVQQIGLRPGHDSLVVGLKK